MAAPVPLAVLGTLLVGAALGVTLQLVPVWWMAWVAPAGLLVLVGRTVPAHAGWYALLACLLATSVLLPYLRSVMPTPVAGAIVVGLALLWRAIALATHRALQRWGSAWGALTFPILWVAADTLMAAVLPDGNVLSYAYTQADVLPVVQVVAVTGVGGMLFLLLLVNATLATVVSPSPRPRGTVALCAATLALVAGALWAGQRRMVAPVGGQPLTVGLASIDDAIGPDATDYYRQHIRDRYDTLVATLASAHAELVVLPEKIAILDTARAADWERHFGATARRHRIWLTVGVAIDSSDGRRNIAWLFDPTGVRIARYHKQYMAPPERDDLAGRDFVARVIAGVPIGIGICKDMHFAAFGRAYGARGVSAVLVPAWDFGRDAWWAQHATIMRGVESGYTVLRSARDGMLSVSDARGRVLAERRSGPMPGVTLVARVPLGPAEPTLYRRLGDVVGWCCVVASLPLLWLLRRRRPRGTRHPVP
ncbi:MAG: hypothetical protein MUF40_06615 [Gemmatimonadaceae bacterium]|nr:hypothetical protein [Gemmatimonadaceae bacterium]